MTDEEKFVIYSKNSILELEKQLLEENIIQNRNIIRKVIRKKRNEEKDSIETDIEKIDDIATLNKLLNESGDFFEKCKIRSTILHLEKIKKQQELSQKNKDEKQIILENKNSKNEINVIKEIKIDDLNKKNISDIIIHKDDIVKICWILPFKILCSIEYCWYYNDIKIINSEEENVYISKFNGKETSVELKNINYDRSGIYKVYINSTRLPKKCQSFKIKVNDKMENELSKIIEEIGENVNYQVNEKHIIVSPETEIKKETFDKVRRFHKNFSNQRPRTMGSAEFAATLSQSLENNYFKSEIRNNEEPRPTIKKFTRSVTSAKDIILTFCKINTTEYKDQGVSIENLSSSWSDGLAFCALIHHFHPEAFDFSKLNSSNRRKNFQLAFETAEKYADIYPVLDIEDMMIMDKPDWKCIFTYVQSFYKTFRSHPSNRLRTMLVS